MKSLLSPAEFVRAARGAMKQDRHMVRVQCKLLKRHLAANRHERSIGINTLALRGRLPQ